MRIGILGYGRFGRALGSLLREAGHAYRAWDPIAEVPAEHRSAGFHDLVAGQDVLVLAVPIPALGGLLGTLRPHLRADHLVFDVGSVKVGPCALLEEHLGAAIPHSGTHPLFGPVSLARAERPLRVVVCGSPRHPASAERIERLFHSLGCEVLRQSPEDHDRVMATTHALTFFIAKGLLAVGAGVQAHLRARILRELAPLLAPEVGEEREPLRVRRPGGPAGGPRRHPPEPGRGG